MKNPAKINKKLVIGLILFVFLISSPICSSYNIQDSTSKPNILLLEQNNDLINITVLDAWDLLNDTSNGIQIPIDVRTEDEWNESFIDTPWPEHPRWIGDIENFMEEFNDSEVIVYSKGDYRSLLFCYIMLDAGFNGTLYNLGGGITLWIEQGLPIRNNTPPYAPLIREDNPRARPVGGPTKNFIFTTIDPDDDKIFLSIDWGDGTYEEWLGPYNSSEDVKLSHTYSSEGTYTVRAKAKDMFEDEGPWGSLVIPIIERMFSNSFLNIIENRFPMFEVFLNTLTLLTFL